mgnify:CR=1 FL=1
MIVNISFDSSNQLRYAFERASTNAFVGDLPEPPFHQIQPGTAGGREVQMKPTMTGKPFPYQLALVGPVVVHNQVQFPIRRICSSINFRNLSHS